MKKRNIKILLEKAAREQTPDILASLKEDGFEESFVFEEIGLLIGSYPDALVEELKTLEGVSNVSEERIFHAIDDEPVDESEPSLTTNTPIHTVKTEEE